MAGMLDTALQSGLRPEEIADLRAPATGWQKLHGYACRASGRSGNEPCEPGVVNPASGTRRREPGVLNPAS